jgi:hypothetical protein
VRDTTGSYQPAWIVAVIGLVLATLLLLITPKPVKPEVEAPEAEPVAVS